MVITFISSGLLRQALGECIAELSVFVAGRPPPVIPGTSDNSPLLWTSSGMAAVIFFSNFPLAVCVSFVPGGVLEAGDLVARCLM